MIFFYFYLMILRKTSFKVLEYLEPFWGINFRLGHLQIHNQNINL